MKKMLFLTLVLLSMAVVAKSQQGQRQTPEQRTEALMVEVKKQMSLPEAKLAQVEKMYLDYYKEMAEMRQSQGGFDRDKMAERRQKFSEKLLTVLTQTEHDKLQEIVTSQFRQGRPQQGL